MPQSIINRKTALQWLASGAALPLLAPFEVSAQAFPNKPLSWIVSFSAGGSADYAARTIGAELSKQLGQGVSIENVAGGGGIVGMTKAGAAPADGHTLYYGGTEMFVPPMVNPKINFDWKKLFRPVGRMLGNPLILVTRADAPYSSLDELTDYAKKNPGKITYGSPGIATGQHFAGEMLREKGKIAIVHIPYRGGAQIVTDLIGGQIETAFLIGSTAMPHLKNGKMKAIAIADATRNPAFPSVPTFNESKTYGGIVLSPFAAMMVPLNTPQASVDTLEAALRKVLSNEDVRKKLTDSGAALRFVGSKEMAAFMAEEQAKYKRIVDFSGIKVSE